jgi:hypothetical protein
MSLATGDIQIVKRDSFWFKRKISVKSLAAYTYLNRVSIYVNGKPKLVADDLCNSFMCSQTPTLTTYPYNRAAGVFVGTGDLEP